MVLKSLKYLNSNLADSEQQIKLLDDREHSNSYSFAQIIEKEGLYPLLPLGIDTLQVNIGKVCNQACKHCHVDAAPDRKESASKEILEKCLEVAVHNKISIVDITGGAPEINPFFRWFVEELRRNNIHVIARCNLTIINSNQRHYDLPEFYSKNFVEVVSSLPYFTKSRTDSQRGTGVFESSINALQKLNAVGYGIDDSLQLNLVYNPAGAFLPGNQNDLEIQFKKELFEKYKIKFNNLFSITNLPISRFLDFLLRTENFDEYMNKLLESFNPAALNNVMCRNMISVGWDGSLYDCDFNQMLEMPVDSNGSQNIFDFDKEKLLDREIITGRHCFGCTAGNGSSCGGSVV